MDFDLVIVGAGAAGLTAAIFAAEQSPPSRVAVLDGAKHPGAKILVAGGGRCNVTNRTVTPADYNGGSRNTIRNVLAAFDVEKTVAWFANMGVSLHEEENGKLFPDTNEARTVRDALLTRLERNGANLLTEHRITRIERTDGGFQLTANNSPLWANRIILATGGQSLPKTGSDGGGYDLVRQLGHSLVPTTPALVPLVLDGDFHKGLSGITQEVELTLRGVPAKLIRITGSLLWTHFGVSGPAVLDMSRHWLRARLENRHTTLSVNMLPGNDLTSTERKWLNLATVQPKIILRNALATWLPMRIADAILSSLRIDGRVQLAHLPKDKRRQLTTALLAWPLPVADCRGYHHAEATAGGVPLDEINPVTMESRHCPGLYLAGEILDVDGRIGGFNFQWAWASGYVAGQAAVRSR